MTDKSPGEWSYEQFADRYAQQAEDNPYHIYYEKPATWSLLPDLDGMHILDAGCGPGNVAVELLDQGAARVTAFDVTPAFVRIATERLKPYGDRAVIRHADLAQNSIETYSIVVHGLLLLTQPDSAESRCWRPSAAC